MSAPTRPPPSSCSRDNHHRLYPLFFWFCLYRCARRTHRLCHIITDLGVREERYEPGARITCELGLDLLVDKDKMYRFPLQNRDSYHAGDVGPQISHVISGARDNLQLRCSVATLKRRLDDADRMRKRIKVEIHNTRQANKALAAVVAIAALSSGFRRCTCYTCEGQMSENTQKCCTGKHDQCAQNWLYLLFVAVRERRLFVTTCGVDDGCYVPPPDPKDANYTPPGVVAQRVRRAVNACRSDGEPFEYGGQAVTDEVMEHTLAEYKELYDEWHKNVIEAPIKIAERVQGILTENRSPCCNQPYEYEESCDVKCQHCGCHFCDLCHRLFRTEADVRFQVPVSARAVWCHRFGVLEPPADYTIVTETRELLLRERRSQYICRLARNPDFSIVTPPMGVCTWHRMVRTVLRRMRVGEQSVFAALSIRNSEFNVVV